MWGRRSLECHTTHPNIYICFDLWSIFSFIICWLLLSPRLLINQPFHQLDPPTPADTNIGHLYQKPTHRHRLPSHIVRNKKNPVKRPELINCRIWALNPELFVAANSCTEGITGVFLRQWRFPSLSKGAVEWLYCIFPVPQQRNRLSPNPNPNFIDTVCGQLSF